MKKLKRYIKKFRENRKAAVLAWVVGLVLMFAYAVIWFTAGWAAFEIVDAVETGFDLESRALNIITLLKMVFAWHPVIVFIGYIIYGFVSSQKRDVRFDI